MFIKPDFSEALEKQKLPDAEYSARIISVEIKTDKNQENYLMWKLSIFGCEGDLARFNNWFVSTMTYPTGKNAWRLKNLCKAVGYEPSADGFDTDELMGKELKIGVVTAIKPDGTTDYPKIMSMRTI